MIEEHFGALKDPRAAYRIEHKLIDIVIITICATICGANDWEAIAEYGRAKQDWLKTWLELPNGIPSSDTFSRVFASINPAQLQKCFMGWMEAVTQVSQDREKPIQQRVEIANQIATSKREIAQIATELKPTKILAPISGTIQELNLRNQSQVVRPSDRVAQILPQNARLEIKAIVTPADIDNVRVGQTVQMRVSACPYTDRGILTGKVSHVAADAKAIEKNGSNNAPQQSQVAANSIYEVTIDPDTLTLGNGATKCQIRSGMEGRVDIISQEETVMQFMLRKARLTFTF